MTDPNPMYHDTVLKIQMCFTRWLHPMPAYNQRGGGGEGGYLDGWGHAGEGGWGGGGGKRERGGGEGVFLIVGVGGGGRDIEV
jgi:hypothetical protein